MAIAETVMQITLVAGSDPIRGEAAIAPCEARTFTGWMELAELIEAARCGEIVPARRAELADPAAVTPRGPVQ